MNEVDDHVDLRAESNYISLFSGAGGLEIAVRLAMPAARAVCYVEREIEAASILAARIADKALDDAPIWSDVSTFDGKPFCGLVDGIVGGFPCQDLSVAGKRAGIQRGNRSGLFYEYARIIREVQPRWVFIENVPAVLAFPAGGIVLGELAKLGFDAEWGSLRASDVRASHGRHRKFILAYRDGWRRDEVWSESARLQGRSHADKRCDSLAYAATERCGEAGRLRCGSDGMPYGPSADMEIPGCDALRRCAGCREEACRGSCAALAGPSGQLGHTNNAGLEGRRLLAGGRADELFAGEAGSGMVFAPGPAHPVWNDVLVRDYGMRPALSQAEAESCLRRVADGLASPLDQRIDRLRACGNGVVAVQGAVALRELIRRVDDGK